MGYASDTHDSSLARENGRPRTAAEAAPFGLAVEDLPHLFEAFWRSERPGTQGAGGTGPSPGIAQRLAKLLGDDIQVTSTLGEGAGLTVDFPAVLPEQGTPRQ